MRSRRELRQVYKWVKVKVQRKTDKMLEWSPSRRRKNPSGYGNQGKPPGGGDISEEKERQFYLRIKEL